MMGFGLLGLKTSLATVLLHFFLLMVAGIVTSFSDDNAIIYVKFYALSTVYFVTAFLLISTYVSFKIRGVVRKHLMDQQRGEKAVSAHHRIFFSLSSIHCSFS